MECGEITIFRIYDQVSLKCLCNLGEYRAVCFEDSWKDNRSAATLGVISSGTGLRHGTLQPMYMEMQVPSPLVSTREVNFLRFSQQHNEGVWLCWMFLWMV